MKLSAAWNWELGIGILEDNVFGQLTPFPSVAVERRREPRISLSLPIRYRQKGKNFPWRRAHSVDVSRNGVRLALDHDIRIGAEVDLDIKLPEVEKPVRLEGVIVWANPSSNSTGVSECGIAFKNLRKLSNREKIMYFMADKICSLADRQNQDLICRSVQSFEELDLVYRLIYQEYLARGYCVKNPAGMYYTFYSLLPGSRTFVLKRNEKLLGTISLITDSPCGLPMEVLFPKEINPFRKPGRKIAEVSLLALDSESFKKRTFTLTDFQKLTGSFRLFKIMFDYARSLGGITDLFLAMHPKHKELYQYLACEVIGEVKSYAGACGNPALPMHLDITKLLHFSELRKRGVEDYFLQKSTPPENLDGHIEWTAEAVENYLVGKRPLYLSMTPTQRDFFKACYPELNLPPA